MLSYIIIQAIGNLAAVTFAGKIDIATALKKLNDTYDEESQDVKQYGVRFIDRNGNVKEFEVQKQVKSPRLHQQAQDARGKAMMNLQRNGVIMLKAVHADHPLTPKVCMIFGFRDHQATEWLRVYH